jgi:hypothetical protein
MLSVAVCFSPNNNNNNELRCLPADDESFPLCLESYPQLCQAGAYYNAMGQKMTYTPTQVPVSTGRGGCAGVGRARL